MSFNVIRVAGAFVTGSVIVMVCSLEAGFVEVMARELASHRADRD
jgi:hypothetical protein